MSLPNARTLAVLVAVVLDGDHHVLPSHVEVIDADSRTSSMTGIWVCGRG